MSKVGDLSTISKGDCTLLINKIHKLEKEIFTYASSGFPERGWGNDFLVKVAMCDLKNSLVELLAKEKMFQ